MKINAYVDGFNFYYGAVRGTRFKWLELRKFLIDSFPEHGVSRVKYFTADVKARKRGDGQPGRQKAYLNALQTLPHFTIHKGLFKTGTRRLPLVGSDPEHLEFANVMYTEEKGSDVNLATELLLDAFRNDASGFIVVSDDSDLIPPIRAVRQILKLPVGVLNPYPWIDPRSKRKRYRKDLRQSITSGSAETSLGYKHLERQLLAVCQLPDPVVDPRTGRQYFKPRNW